MIRMNLAMLYVRTGSHRCRERIARELGYSDRFDSPKPKMAYFYTWETAGAIIAVSQWEYERIRGIPGVTRYRGKKVPMRCWS